MNTQLLIKFAYVSEIDRNAEMKGDQKKIQSP